MDSSSDFGPVGGGFMVFHFCGKRGCLKIFAFIGEYIFSGWFRAKDAKGAKFGKKRTAKYAEYANRNFSRNNSIQPQMNADERRWKGLKAKDGGCRLNHQTVK